MKAEDWYEKGFREALAMAATQARSQARKYRKIAEAHEGDGTWKTAAAEGAGTALAEFGKGLAAASKGQAKP